MESHYKHLNAEERGVIFAENRRGSSLRQIGLLLGRHHGTIGLELTRGAAPGGYDPQVARLARDTAQLRSGRRRKLVPAAPFYDWVRNRLIHWCWSPEQIAARLRRMHPDDPSQRVSHETIYAAIYAQPRGGLKTLMIEALRQAKPKRGARRSSLAGSSMVPETLRIMHRPEDIEARLVPGHWEGLVARVIGWVEFSLTRRFGQVTTSNLAWPSPVILLRMWVPILASVFWLGKLRAFSLGPMTAFQRPITVSPRLR